ncbi:MAG: DUF177 domain-containing protein [Bacteroidetes bacterium]|nr:DUF177 domain-containing protein [Bacteroidota bacterium]
MEKKSHLKAFDVKFSGLKLGKHLFDFHLNDDFLKHYENSLVTQSDVAVSLELDKQSELLYILNFDLKGSINLNCDRCLTTFDLPVSDSYRMVMKVDSEMKSDQDDDIIFVSSHDLNCNVADYLYEFILLQLPLKVTCEMAELECDKEMINKLNNISSKEDPIEDESPWTKLQELKNKFKED